jgi:hypothetical protein
VLRTALTPVRMASSVASWSTSTAAANCALAVLIVSVRYGLTGGEETRELGEREDICSGSTNDSKVSITANTCDAKRRVVVLQRQHRRC